MYYLGILISDLGCFVFLVWTYEDFGLHMHRVRCYFFLFSRFGLDCLSGEQCCQPELTLRLCCWLLKIGGTLIVIYVPRHADVVVVLS